MERHFHLSLVACAYGLKMRYCLLLHSSQPQMQSHIVVPFLILLIVTDIHLDWIRCLEAFSHNFCFTSKGRGICNKFTGRRISAVTPMVFSRTPSYGPLLDLADYYQLAIVEDAAESLGSFIDLMTLALLDMLAFKLNYNKIITTGGGGAILPMMLI